MAGHAKKCVERYWALANKTSQQFYKVSTPCIDDHHFKEEQKSMGELSKTCSQIDLKSLYLTRIGRPDILWSVNKLARSITKWTKACDKRLIRLISYSTVMWVILPNNADWDCSKTLTSREILKIQKITSGGTLCVFRKSYLCSNKLDVQETNCCFSQFNRIWNHLNTSQRNKARGDSFYGETWSSFHTSHDSETGVINDSVNVDFVLSDVKSSHREALLYVTSAISFPSRGQINVEKNTRRLRWRKSRQNRSWWRI